MSGQPSAWWSPLSGRIVNATWSGRGLRRARLSAWPVKLAWTRWKAGVMTNGGEHYQAAERLLVKARALPPAGREQRQALFDEGGCLAGGPPRRQARDDQG